MAEQVCIWSPRLCQAATGCPQEEVPGEHVQDGESVGDDDEAGRECYDDPDISTEVTRYLLSVLSLVHPVT